jgi:putative transcriptional regulator
MTKFGADLIASLTEALDFAQHKQPAPGEPAARVHLVKMPDTRAIRRGLRMSQHEFAEAFRIPVATVKNWEQGRRVPDAPAAAYLQVIARRPDMILEALRGAAG